MARNEEKHFCNLNRLILFKEKEEYEKAHPQRPKLDSLCTPEEIQKWLPSIKKDIDFYLKKSQVTCYSDAHIEECREKVVKLEKEFKAFVRKIKRLAPSPLDVIPWTSRPYKRKKENNSEEELSKEFKRIATPILDDEKNNPLSHSGDRAFQYADVNRNLMDQPLSFSSASTSEEKTKNGGLSNINANISDLHPGNSNSENCIQCDTTKVQERLSGNQNVNKTNQLHNIVNYESSDNESS